MPNYVYSTASNDSIFVRYGRVASGKPAQAEAHVLIRGKANVALGRAEFVTKLGVRTEVSDEELEILNNSSNFCKMVDAGFMTVEKRKVDPEKIALSMSRKDKSAPLVPSMYKDDDLAKPKVSKG